LPEGQPGWVGFTEAALCIKNFVGDNDSKICSIAAKIGKNDENSHNLNKTLERYPTPIQ